MGDKGKAPYAWLALWALLRFRGGDDDPERMELLRIDAVAGQFRRSPSNAANDQAAALLILLLTWWMACAKYRAKLIEFGASPCKLAAGRFHPAIPLESAWLRLVPVSALILALCHNDHLPTIRDGTQRSPY